MEPFTLFFRASSLKEEGPRHISSTFFQPPRSKRRGRKGEEVLLLRSCHRTVPPQTTPEIPSLSNNGSTTRLVIPTDITVTTVSTVCSAS
jgi:hypothetical protein